MFCLLYKYTNIKQKLKLEQKNVECEGVTHISVHTSGVESGEIRVVRIFRPSYKYVCLVAVYIGPISWVYGHDCRVLKNIHINNQMWNEARIFVIAR